MVEPSDSIAVRTCHICGMLLRNAGEFHPHAFCVLRRAGYMNPWGEVRTLALQLGLPDPGQHPPLVTQIHDVGRS